MNKETIKYILEHPNENGIVVFVLGILFILSIYHFLLYFQHKDKSYLYYSLYTFLIFISHINESSNNFISTLSQPFIGSLNHFDQPLMWLYNAIYFIFAFTFLNLKIYSKKWYTIITYTIGAIIILIVISSLLSLFSNSTAILDICTPYIVLFYIIFSIICYYPLFKLKMPLRYYIIIGSLVLFISSLIAYYLPSPFEEVSYTVFYLGIIIENIIFSLGLGHKQKLILQEKNDSQQKLIFQLKENEKLKLEIQKKLEEDVASFSKQAEKEKFKKLKAEYDKELAELKISSLQSQMNPHFIFNSLNAIKLYIIDNEKENAVYYLNKFSKLIRKILASAREKENTLAEEIDTLKLYLEIENIRFQNEIKSSFSIDKKLNLNTLKVPSLILQPFIENAIWHGLSSKKGKKEINLIFEKEKNSHLKITIEDNGIGRKKSAEIKNNKVHRKESIGIQLTEERLINFSKEYENDYLITFIDLKDNKNNATGTLIVLKIPLQ